MTSQTVLTMMTTWPLTKVLQMHCQPHQGSDNQTLTKFRNFKGFSRPWTPFSSQVSAHFWSNIQCDRSPVMTGLAQDQACKFHCLSTSRLIQHFTALILFCANWNFKLRLCDRYHLMCSMCSADSNLCRHPLQDILLHSWTAVWSHCQGFFKSCEGPAHAFIH